MRAQDLVSTSVFKSFRYWHLRYTAKLGLVYNTDRFGAGLTFTTPGVKLFGQGSVSADVLATNIKPGDEIELGIDGLGCSKQIAKAYQP